MLFKFDFTQKCKHRALLLECNEEEFVTQISENCKCREGNKYFQSKQGLPSHIMWANPTSECRLHSDV